LSLRASSVPLLLQGDPELSTLALGGAALVPSIYLVSRIPGGRALKGLLGLGVAASLALWVVARLAGLGAFDALDSARAFIATTATAAVVIDGAVMPILSGQLSSMCRPRLFDLAVVAALSGASLVLVTLLAVPPIVVGGLVLLILVVFPGVRRWAGPRVAAALLADVREQAAIGAAEDERARMARELHDVPLQHLSGIIRRLDLLPDAQAESDQLRVVADQLRSVATDLRPPVLDDLGLAAALGFLAEKSTSTEAPVVAMVISKAGLDPASRPPSAAELAVFRIAQEAVSNALRHADAHEVRIEGRIEPDLIHLAIVDDGVGLRSEVIRAAGRRGRLGLASMRRRAEAIEAELSVDGSSHGTTVRIVWQG